MPRFLAYLRRMCTGKVIASICGHQTELKGTVAIFGEVRHIHCDSIPSYCLSCLPLKSIQCGMCRRVIFPLEPIGLAPVPKEGKASLPKQAAVHKGYYAYCLRCAELGIADAVAIWMPDNGGIVKKRYDEIVSCY